MTWVDDVFAIAHLNVGIHGGACATKRRDGIKDDDDIRAKFPLTFVVSALVDSSALLRPLLLLLASTGTGDGDAVVSPRDKPGSGKVGKEGIKTSFKSSLMMNPVFPVLLTLELLLLPPLELSVRGDGNAVGTPFGSWPAGCAVGMPRPSPIGGGEGAMTAGAVGGMVAVNTVGGSGNEVAATGDGPIGGAEGAMTASGVGRMVGVKTVGVSGDVVTATGDGEGEPVRSGVAVGGGNSTVREGATVVSPGVPMINRGVDGVDVWVISEGLGVALLVGLPVARGRGVAVGALLLTGVAGARVHSVPLWGGAKRKSLSVLPPNRTATTTTIVTRDTKTQVNRPY